MTNALAGGIPPDPNAACGRKKEMTSAGKIKFLSVRLTVEEREDLDRMARESGLSLSNVIRSCIDRTEIRQRQPAAINDLYKEINRIGVNINQIARRANAGIATQKDVKEALFLLRQVYALMEKVADL